MEIRRVAGLGVLLAAALGGATVCDASSACRVRIVRSANGERIARQIVREVEAWVGHHASFVVVPSIQEADVVLELDDSIIETMSSGMVVQTLRFVVRDLAEGNSDRAIHRYILSEPWPVPAGERYAARWLARKLGDACDPVP